MSISGQAFFGDKTMKAPRFFIALAVALFSGAILATDGQCQGVFNAEVVDFKQVDKIPDALAGRYERVFADLKEIDALDGARIFTFDFDLDSKTEAQFVRIDSALCSADGQCQTDLYNITANPPRLIFSAIVGDIAVQTGDIVAAPGEHYPGLLTNVGDFDAKTRIVANPKDAKLWNWDGKMYLPTNW
jgi:hypothetical protein